MKTKNLFISLLLALLLMPVGAKAAETMDFTDDVTNIMYTIRISSDNVPEAAVVTGIKAPKSTMTQLPGTVDLTIPETLTFGNSGTSYTIPIIGIQSVSVNGKGNGNTYLKSVTIGTNVKAIAASAFKGCPYLQTVTITDAISNQAKLTTIGASAFEGCSKLASITIPKTVTSIGAEAFSGCTKLTSVSLTTKASTIGANAFLNCGTADGSTDYVTLTIRKGGTVSTVPGSMLKSQPYVKSIVLGSGITTIAPSAFQEMEHLQSITLPTTLTTIGENAFLNSGLKTITLNEGLQTIGINAFNRCQLEAITIPQSVTSIGAGAFNYCTALESADIQGQITYLPNQVFQACVKLTNVTLPSTLEVIGENIFSLCDVLASITLPASVTTIKSAAFCGCEVLKDITFEGMTPPEVVIDDNGDLFRNKDDVTSNIDHSTITLHVPFGAGAAYSASDSYWHDFNIVQTETAEIADGALRYRLHTGTTEAENWAEVLGLSDEATTWLAIPESVSYGGQSFSVTAIAEASFVQKSLEYVELPATVQSIGTRAFEENHSLTSVHISGDSQLQTIGMGAFRGCDTFESINLPYSLQTIAEQAFANCTSLKWVNLPEGLATVGESAFVSCTSLESIDLPTTLLSIGEKCFAGAGLKQIRIPNSNCSIGQSAFTCASLEKVTVSSDWETFPSTAFKLAILTNGTTVSANFDLVVECGSRNYINMNFAQGCNNIKSVAIGSGVENIYVNAFADCQNMTSVSIPVSVNNIYTKAFGISNPNSHTSALTDVTVSWTTPITLDGTADHDPFPRDSEGNHTNISLHVPSGTETAYQENTYWKTFFSETHPIQTYTNIAFADAQVKAVCVQNWDTNGDGELSVEEAAVVTSLEGAEFPDDITSFNELQYFTSLTAIESFAFSSMSELTEITFPSSLTTIGSFAFQSCSSLTNLVIPEGVTSIESFAFQNYTGIVTLPTTLTSISSVSFQNAQGAKVSWPEPPAALTQDFYSAFGSQRDKLLYVPLGSYDIYDDTPTWWAFDIREYGNILFADANVKAICVDAANGWDTNGDGELSAEEALAVTSIGTVFSESIAHTAITSFNELKFFRSLTEIPAYAFSKCTNLASVVLPKSITSIDTYAFWKSGLTAIDIHKEVTTIGGYAFDQCTSLATVNLPSYGLETIGSNAFSGTTALERITIPSTVTSMNDAFQGSGLKYVTVYWGGEWTDPLAISENTFTSRTTATLFVPEGTVEEYKAAQYWKDFQNITTKIDFNDPKVKAICVANWDTNGDGELTKDEAAAVTTLGMAFTFNTEIKTFEELKYFTGLKWNNAVPALTGGDNQHGAFDGCTNLSYVTMPENIEQIMNFSFRGCTSLANVNIPSGVHTILDYAFQGCTALSYANMPQALKYIGAHAFDGCSSLRWMAFPNQVITYGDQAFNSCSSLTQVTVNSSVPGNIYGNPFPARADISLTVPAHAAATYQATDYWKEFKNFQEQEPNWTGEFTDANGDIYQYETGYYAQLKHHAASSSRTTFTVLSQITVDGTDYPVRSISENAINASYLTTLTIPASITTVKRDAFSCQPTADGMTLKTIIMQGSVPPTAEGFMSWETSLASYNAQMEVQQHMNPDLEFTRLSLKDITLKVPAGAKTAYEADNVWKKFTIEELTPGDGDANGDGTIDINDVLAVVNYILGKDVPEGFDTTKADVTGDGSVTIADATAILSIILQRQHQ